VLLAERLSRNDAASRRPEEQAQIDLARQLKRGHRPDADELVKQLLAV